MARKANAHATLVGNNGGVATMRSQRDSCCQSGYFAYNDLRDFSKIRPIKESLCLTSRSIQDARKGCIIQDRSYYGCFKLKVESHVVTAKLEPFLVILVIGCYDKRHMDIFLKLIPIQLPTDCIDHVQTKSDFLNCCRSKAFQDGSVQVCLDLSFALLCSIYVLSLKTFFKTSLPHSILYL